MGIIIPSLAKRVASSKLALASFDIDNLGFMLKKLTLRFERAQSPIRTMRQFEDNDLPELWFQ